MRGCWICWLSEFELSSGRMGLYGLEFGGCGIVVGLIGLI